MDVAVLKEVIDWRDECCFSNPATGTLHEIVTPTGTRTVRGTQLAAAGTRLTDERRGAGVFLPRRREREREDATLTGLRGSADHATDPPAPAP